MLRSLKISAITLVLLAQTCGGEDNPIHNWKWPDGSGSETTGDETIDDSVGKPLTVWIDASANFQYFANDKAKIESDLKKIKEMGFNEVVVDVRPSEGTVLFKSDVAPETKRLACWIGSDYKFIERTASFDYLQAFIDCGHELGLKVNASVNTFVGGFVGYYGLGNEGPIFTGEIPAEWATVDNTSKGLKSNLEINEGGAVFLNPANDRVKEYLLKLLAELAAYDVDGIVLDRCRYDDCGLQSDFSETTKKKFLEYHRWSFSWPLFKAGTTELPKILTSEQKSWLAFRAKTIHDFVEKAAATVHGVNPDIKFGCYVGAWYSTYYESGVNWASPKYDTHKDYSWANSEYDNYGFANHCDFMILGCYASASSIYGTGEWTMQGFAKQGKDLLLGACPFVAGPDIGNADGFADGGQGSKLYSTVDACLSDADGYFCFDLSHIRMFDYWKAYRNAITTYRKSVTK